MSPRKALFQLHWIFGITAGVVLALVGATGALLSFEQQIVASLARDSRQVEAKGRTALAPAELLARVAANEPQKRITGLNITREPVDTARVTFAPREQRYVDPYTGALLPAASGGAETFFRNVRQLHRWLMLGELGDRDIGRQIVGASTLLLVFMALTGLYLRWPRGPAARRFKTWLVPDFRLKGRAFLWNLHSVIGTWVLPIYLVIALTGLQWSYEWYRNGLYSIAGVERPAGGEGGPREGRGGGQSAARDSIDIPTFARAWDTFSHEAARFSSVNVNLAAPSDRPLEFRYLDSRPSHERAFNTLAIDKEGRVAKSERFQDKEFAAQLVSSIFPLHSGSYFGLAGVIVFLMASLAMPLFAVTGWIMYLERRAPRPRRESVAAATEEAG
ncbi:MAG TPA: PepSY-associated TM helix domain-containing protein [Steroidobacteraceae bacterium]|nr:PepSY-associated TM helix domain-containing protein [Steroidobacteraceae bacterium]